MADPSQMPFGNASTAGTHDFDFSFDPAAFPPPPPLPPSADLFSPSETTDLFGFLDTFNWDLDADLFQQQQQQQQQNQQHLPDHDFETLQHSQLGALPGDDDAHALMPPAPFQSFMSPPPSFASDLTHTPTQLAPPSGPMLAPAPIASPSTSSPRRASRSPPAHASSSSTISGGSGNGANASKQSKALLSSPQKRLNHIMSEQKRRNAIRDGYAQLTTLLAPKGAPPGSGMPTRGRPKGSGARAKPGRTKGKSGVLFRAVDYIHWLDDGIGALRAEVDRVERMAGIAAPA